MTRSASHRCQPARAVAEKQTKRLIWLFAAQKDPSVFSSHPFGTGKGRRQNFQMCNMRCGILQKTGHVPQIKSKEPILAADALTLQLVTEPPRVQHKAKYQCRGQSFDKNLIKLEQRLLFTSGGALSNYLIGASISSSSQLLCSGISVFFACVSKSDTQCIQLDMVPLSCGIQDTGHGPLHCDQ